MPTSITTSEPADFAKLVARLDWLGRCLPCRSTRATSTHHWLKVRLVGKKTNKAAIGAKLRIDLAGPGGSCSILRVIGNNGSFGGNPLVESIGLRDAKSVDRLTVTWPGSKTTQVFQAIAADQSIEITEGTDAYNVVTRKPLPRPKP
jgi:hypothetical protein